MADHEAVFVTSANLNEAALALAIAKTIKDVYATFALAQIAAAQVKAGDLKGEIYFAGQIVIEEGGNRYCGA